MHLDVSHPPPHAPHRDDHDAPPHSFWSSDHELLVHVLAALAIAIVIILTTVALIGR